MKIIIDTCIWSLALRKTKVESNPYIEELKNLIEEIRVQLIGPIRQTYHHSPLICGIMHFTVQWINHENYKIYSVDTWCRQPG